MAISQPPWCDPFGRLADRRYSREMGPGVGKAVVALCLISCTGLASCVGSSPGGGSSLEKIRARGELLWGADIQGGAPYAFETPQGEVIGFEVDLANIVAADLGVRARVVQNDWSTLIPSLERGTFDIALNGLEVTPERARRVALSRPYYAFTQRLVARRGDPRVHDLKSLRNLRVGTMSNSVAWGLLVGAGAVPLPYEGVNEPLIDLERHRIDAVLLDDVIIERYIDQHPSLVSVVDVADGQYAIALRPGDEELRTAIDRTLGQTIASGRWRQTLQKWNLDNARQESLANGRGSTITKSLQGGGRLLTPGQLLLFLEGAVVTLLLSLAAMAIAIPLGMLLTYLRLEFRDGGRAATIYVEVVRGTPVLLQLYVIYYGISDVVALGPWVAAIVGLGLNYAAYESEIFRAGVASVPRAQWEAAMALGASRRVALRTVIAKQAMRLALPGMTNDFISLLKDSSLVSVLTVVELTKRMTIVAVDSRGWVVPGVLCAALYMGLGYPFAFLARRLEARLDRQHVG